MSTEAKRGRPGKYGEFDALVAACPPEMRRPKYLERIGIRRGVTGDTVWVKVQLPKGGTWRGRIYPPRSAIEIKLGRRTSIDWGEALAQRDELQRRADLGEQLEKQPAPTFTDTAQDWLSRKRGNVADFVTIRGHVEKHLIPFFGETLMPDISARDVERWIADERQKDYAAGYIKRMLNTLRSILNDSLRAGEIDENITKGIRVTGAVERQRFLEAEEIIRLLIAAESIEPWLADVIVWALHSGMRRGEIQRLRWSDIRDLPTGGRVVLLQSSKSGKVRRVICTGAMTQVLDRQDASRADDDGRVFPVSKMTWRRRWEKARANAELEDIDFHDLRRTNATQAAASGVDLRTLAARIGHTNLAMLERHYAMVVGSAEHEAAEKIQNTFDALTGNVVPIKAGS